MSNQFQDSVPSLFQEMLLPTSRQEERFPGQFQLNLRYLVISRLYHYPRQHKYPRQFQLNLRHLVISKLSHYPHQLTYNHSHFLL